MKTKLTPIQILGLCLLPISMAIFHYVPHTRGTLEGVALLNYPIAIIYFFLSFADRPKDSNLFKSGQPKLNWHICLSLMMISCFTLNKDMHIFAVTPIWVQCFLALTLFSFILVAYKNNIPLWIGKTASFLLGMGITLYTYYAIVLLPLLPVAFIGLILLGLSIHLLIPTALIIWGLIVTFKDSFINARPKQVITGIMMSVLFICIYTGIYQYHDKQIKGAQKELVLNEDRILPEWVAYAQNSTSPFWTKRIVGRNLLYEVHTDDWWSFSFNRGSFSEIRKHDPLIATAALFTDKLPLSNKEQVHVLSANANTRHYAYEKLWSGKHLKVSKELTDARIYPEYRMAYFEKTIWIENNSSNDWSQEEALFTFHLPDGAVASSLSLWIDGKEEKSRLTTRKKATNAYKTIVGKEMRDPVVLHWQEGNRLTATIFPCTVREARRVKIGITAPLQLKGNKLHFESMQIQGPDNSDAEELIHVKILGKSTNAKLPRSFKEELPKQYIYEGKALEHWTCSFQKGTLSNNAFSFNGKSWKMEDIKYAKQDDSPKAIYLDINKNWSENEVMMIMASAGNIPIYIHFNDFIKIDLTNKNKILDKVLIRPFSLLPIFDIPHPESALIITKGSDNSPIPSELKNSVFHEKLIQQLSNQDKPIATIVLEAEKSPYITALEQFKLLDCRNKTSFQLQGREIKTWFKHYKTDEGAINIPMSGISIIPSTEHETEEKAPSHLLRLYNYHSLMQEAGNLFLQEDAEIPESIYNLCNEAFIVTPVSNLIVLESKKDYDRFGIKKNENSLQNANLQDSGAVPEPHEWALIIALGALLCFMYFKFR